MTLRHMKIFVTVYQHSSVTKAAGELHLAQPSVSLAVKELEEYYGIRLFDRIGRGIRPTEAGSEFYSYALHIVSLFEDMEKSLFTEYSEKDFEDMEKDYILSEKKKERFNYGR